MSFWTAVVIIVAIGAVTSVIRGRQRANAGIIADKQGNESYIQQGDADAQFELGFCYANGKGVEQDQAEAVSWYRKAAEQGDVRRLRLWRIGCRG